MQCRVCSNTNMDIRKSSRSPRLIVADRTPLPAALVAGRLKIVLWLFWNFERAPPLSEWTKLLHWVIDINRLHCIVRYLWWCRSIWEETRWIWNAMCICCDFGFIRNLSFNWNFARCESLPQCAYLRMLHLHEYVHSVHLCTVHIYASVHSVHPSVQRIYSGH